MMNDVFGAVDLAARDHVGHLENHSTNSSDTT